MREMQIAVRLPSSDGAWMDYHALMKLLPEEIAPLNGSKIYIGEVRDDVGYLFDVVLTITPAYPQEQ